MVETTLHSIFIVTLDINEEEQKALYTWGPGVEATLRILYNLLANHGTVELVKEFFDKDRGAFIKVVDAAFRGSGNNFLGWIR